MAGKTSNKLALNSDTNTTSGLGREPAVCVVGNLNADLIVRGVPALPEWGQEVAGTSHALVTSGQAGYLALGLAKLDVPTALIANVGDDHQGATILEDLRSAGVATDGVEISKGATGISVAAVRPDGERAFLSHFASLGELDEALIERRWSTGSAAPVLCLVGLFSIPGLDPGAGARLLTRARAEGRRTVLDTGWDPDGWSDATVAGVEEMLAATTIFLPNLDEATAITGERDPLAAARALRAHGPDLIVVKCGAEGSVALTADGATERMDAIAVEAVDAVGAGDSFNAAFLFAHLAGWSLRQALAFASAAAGLYVSRATARHATAPEAVAAAKPLGVALPSIPDPTNPTDPS
ncbi:MAG TPA: carbohydrate kinase family protein [Baekduia sp.]|uniref:carbohydrate kinase family protein n=1 Tax=Baekduia sp. TaxID=2600305 RepID=UPI002D7A3BF4|nr:carbohydrate kinase family protein [Baekduia sp.]HET6507787.1 carbohydrate kinase family protein [Baekduia sp.]